MKRNIILFIIAVFMLAAVTGCAEKPPQEERERGSVTFTFEVTGSDGKTNSREITTQETTVGAALLEAGIIEGEESSFGLMVIYVNGERADYNEDGAYWAFYIDGEFAMEGVDAAVIEQGRVYAFVYTEA